MDLFKDYFTRETLANTLLKIPYVPGRLGELGIFSTRGLTNTTALIEEMNANDVTVSASVPRGSPPTAITTLGRKMHTFTCATYAWASSVMADEVLNVRAAGSGAAEVIATRIAEKTAKLRRQADLQHESLRIACLTAPSNTIGTAPAAQIIAVQTDATRLREELFNKVQKPIESALGGIPYTGMRVFCSDGYWAKLIESKWIKDTYMYSAAAAAMRSGNLTDEITIGPVTFERYRGGGVVALATDTATCIPMGVYDLFLQCFAPDDTLLSVGNGAMGAPYYLNSLMIEGDKGYTITLQSHPLMVCTRPEAIISLKMA